MDLPARLQAIDDELEKQLARLDTDSTHAFHEMLTYHMGWTGEDAGPEVQGKRIRPLLLLLVVESCGAEWLRAIPAAAAVELIHNFSLIHDDIEDASELRHGRATVWSKWGLQNGINAGDAMFVLANLAALDLAQDFPGDITARAAAILNRACLQLTSGQYLDINFEGRTDLELDAYWEMIRGKTAALLAASAECGALLGGASAERLEAFRSFGEDLGMAFQVQDDILGIWGDEKITGKSAAADLAERKVSLPVWYGLRANGAFAELWRSGPIPAHGAAEAARLLETSGAREYAEIQSRELTARALGNLETAQPAGDAGRALFELAHRLLGRNQ